MSALSTMLSGPISAKVRQGYHDTACKNLTNLLELESRERTGQNSMAHYVLAIMTVLSAWNIV